jgi:NTP pyrophosphatase (non-canonical NTP hydrolase)
MEKVTQTYTSLNAANAARQAEWPGVEKIDLAFRGLELAGEAGEACNIMKKLERQRRGIQGSTSSLAALGEELSDVVISAYLCAFTAGIDLDAYIPYKFNQTSKAQGLATRMAAYGGIASEPATSNIDELAIDRFAIAMKTKMAIKAKQGRGGWNDKSQCSNAHLSALLREHVEKGDPVDVANLAMMIHQRSERIV